MADDPERMDVRQDAVQAPPSYSQHAIHLVRTVQLNTLKLSQMADQKASILMGATFLVFSLTVSRALVGELSWAMIVLAFSAFLSSLCAVIAVLPSIKKPRPGTFKPNKLFFGHFSDLDEEEWQADVLHELEQDETVFRAMLHDIYQNGQVLQRRKYRFLGIAYRIFIAGLFVTMAIYAAEFALLG
ncbi:Pycsar system effector family protein [Altererythrobacter sp.]|uniref:Pycsar system effector family protein n=1 Tax=Altererythrobacter sp. TaxID=1872480 RepID=UPI003D02F70E